MLLVLVIDKNQNMCYYGAYPKKQGFFNLNNMSKDQIKNYMNYWEKMAKIGLKSLFLMVIVITFCLPDITHSQDFLGQKTVGPIAQEAIRAYYDGPTLPNIGQRKPRRTTYVMVTAYNSLPEQTDDTPFITASGTRTRDGVVAANFLPIGTVVRFPEVFGDKEFVVEDRMNARYYYNMDIWMESYADARAFGAKFLKVEIL